MEPKDGLEGFLAFVALHKNQLQSSAVPEHLWQTLYNKLKHGTFDAGGVFNLARLEESEDEDEEPIGEFCSWKVLVSSPNGLKAYDTNQIYLIDHAWTFRPDQARSTLQNYPNLLERMCNLMAVEFGDNSEESISQVMKNVWKYSQTYSIGNANLQAEDRLPVWYVMDEFGCRIQHSDEPKARVVPFFYLNEQAAYSLLFPITDLDEGEEVSRDFVEGCATDVVTRDALLSSWTSSFRKKYLPYLSLHQPEPSAEYFHASRVNETMPNASAVVPPLTSDRPIRVYVEYEFIRNFLKSPRFQLVDSEQEADILWLATHFKNYKQLSEESGDKRINQFPCEHVITVKDLLCIVARRAASQPQTSCEALEDDPVWLPTTFNLKTELPQFVAYYLAQESKSLANYWIVKPWNLARSLDTHVTDSLDLVLRLAVSGPKIAQRYIDRPVLFHRQDIDERVKFDVRYIILLSSVQPLKAYAYRRFWLRFANRPFELDHFDEYERHFTVMNYSATNLHQMFCHDFIRLFEEQYPDQSWGAVEAKIFDMLKQVLVAASSGPAAGRIVHNPQSRAMYAVDLMLKWDDKVDNGAKGIQPQLLEINWAPDCERACLYYPEFFDDIFHVLFLDDAQGRNVAQL